MIMENNARNNEAKAQSLTQTEKDEITLKTNITNAVMKKLTDVQNNGGVIMPKGYNASNQLYLAMLQLSELKDRNGNFVLQQVTQASVANALFRMCIMGLSLSKAQCAFIKHDNSLDMQTEYFGRVLIAKRDGGAGNIVANVIYEKDVFQYSIDTKTGNRTIVKHEQSLSNIDNAKIVGAWASVEYAGQPERPPYVEVMTIAEIRTAWMQGATKGSSPAHNNFTQEMCKKTVISRAVKMFMSTSSDNNGDIASVSDNGIDDQSEEIAKDIEFLPESSSKALNAEVPAKKTATMAKTKADTVVKPYEGKSVADDADVPSEEGDEEDGFDLELGLNK